MIERLALGTGAGAAPRRGLSVADVQERRAKGLGNQMPVRTSRTYGQIVRENVFTFINLVIFVLGLALVILGRPSDALVSVGVISVNTLVSLVQEVRAKRTLDHIALITRPTVVVLRDGQEQAVDPNEIVVGDLAVARPGDQIVCDGQVVEGAMDVDESLLTGESDLVHKRAGDPVYSGSFCTTGAALYEVQKVGAASLANQMTASARAFRRVLTPLQEEINLLIRVILFIAAYFELMVWVITVFTGVPLVVSVQMSTVIAGLVPNGLFLAIALAYAMGAVRMVGKGVLVQQANAVESLSNVDVLCLDKTGTLTTNRIRFDAVHPIDISERQLCRLLGDFVASASSRNRTSEAIAAACPGQPRPVLAEVPFSSAYKWSALTLGSEEPRTYVLGAPEMLFPYLAAQNGLRQRVSSLAEQGLRVLLFGCYQPPVPLPQESEPTLPQGLLPLGLVALSDELRPDAKETLAAFAQTGVQIKIVSGDNPSTAAALAIRAGMGPDLRVLSGADLAQMNDVQLSQAASQATVFGRVSPQQKERLVQALRDQGHYVAMVGDGVNDVLALKKANLAIALNSGSQATRSVADIVLLDDSFSALPHALQEGQRIVNGMQDILKIFLVRVFYAAMLIMSVEVVSGFPFSPKQNAILTLLTVGIPSIALAAWARPGPVPRGRLVRRLLGFVLPSALTLGLFGLATYLAFVMPTYFRNRPLNPGLHPADYIFPTLPLIQTALTSFLVLCGILLLLFVEPPSSFWAGGDRLAGNPKITWLALGLLAAYAAVLAVPSLRSFFELVLLSPAEYVVIALAASAWVLVLRWLRRGRILERFFNVDLSPS